MQTEKDHNNAVLRDKLAQLVQDVIDGVESPATARQFISAAILSNSDLAEFGEVCLSQIEGAEPKETKQSAIIAALQLADRIIHGNENHFGLLDCMDQYYGGAFDEDLSKFKELKTKAGL